MSENKNLLLENQLCFPIYATSRLITRLYKPFLSELGLTYPQYLVMLVLWENNKLNVSDISQKLLLNTNTMTPLLHTMQKKGLIIKTKSPDDERQIIIELTKKGGSLEKNAANIPEKLAQSSHIPIEELAQLRAGMWKMLKYLQ
jgi:DNA-binding MarR family transcriptional regulator